MGKYTQNIAALDMPKSKYSDAIQALNAPQVESEPSGLDTAAKWASRIGAAAGTAAPIVGAAMEGAPMLPVLGGLAAGAGAGALTNYALEKTGATPWLNKKASELRNSVYLPSIPENTDIPWKNLAANLGINAIDPRAKMADALEAAPMLASSYIGAKAGMGMGNKLMPKTEVVPKGQEASALMDMANKNFETPAALPTDEGISQKGNFRQATKAARTQLGNKVGAATNAAAEAVNSNPQFDPADLSQKVQDAIKGVVSPQDIKRNPQAVSALFDIGKDANFDTFDEAQGLQGRIGDLYKKTLKPNDPANSMASPIWAKANKAVSSILDQHIQDFGGKAAEAVSQAKEPFGQWATLQDLTNKAFSKGEFSPSRFVDNWKGLSDADKAAKLDPEQVKAIDEMVKQPDKGLVQKIGSLLSSGAKIIPAKLGMGRLSGLFEQMPNPVTFNKPVVPMTLQNQNALAIGSAVLPWLNR